MEPKSGSRAVVVVLAVIAGCALVATPLAERYVQLGASAPTFVTVAAVAPLLLALAAVPRLRTMSAIGLWALAAVSVVVAGSGAIGIAGSGTFRLTDLLTVEGLVANISEVMAAALATVAVALALMGWGASSGRRPITLWAMALAAFTELGMVLGIIGWVRWLGGSYRTSGSERWGLVEAVALAFSALALIVTSVWWARWAPRPAAVVGRSQRRRWAWGVSASVVIVALVAAGGTWWTQHRVSGVDVAGQFADPALADCVEHAVGGEKVPADTLATLLDLDCSSSGAITSLQGIENLPKLSTLNLANNHVADISPVTGLHELTAINLSQNPVSDISALHGLTHLRSVNIDNDHVTDLSPLAGLPLQRLNAGNNTIDTLATLGAQPSLTILNVGGNQLSGDLTIGAMHQLDQLDISHNRVTGIANVCTQGNPRQFHADHNQIADATQFAGCTSTTELWIGSNPVTDISALTSMPKLVGVDLADTGQLPAGIDVVTAKGIYVGGMAK